VNGQLLLDNVHVYSPGRRDGEGQRSGAATLGAVHDVDVLRAFQIVDLVAFHAEGTVVSGIEDVGGRHHLLDALFLSRTSGEWEKSLQGNDDIIWERVQRNLDLPTDPQVVANDYIVEYDHPAIGPSNWLQTPVTYSKTPLSTRKMAPVLGENTEETLIGLLGYSWDDIVVLKDKKVIL